MGDWKKQLADSMVIEPDIVFIHACKADRKNKEELTEIIKEIKGFGKIAGCATHNPLETIPFLEYSDLDVKLYMIPVNMIGRFMGREPEKVKSIIENASRF